MKGRSTAIAKVFLNKERAELYASKRNENNRMVHYFVQELEVVDYQDTVKELVQGFKTKSGSWAITGYVNDMNKTNILGILFEEDTANNLPIKSYSTERARRSPVPDKPEPRP